MVKGNWERRVERAAKQSGQGDAAAAKPRPARRLPGHPECRVLKDPDASARVAGQGNKLCAAYFRNGDCPNRRCKWSHAETIALFGTSGPRKDDGAAARGADGGRAVDGPVSKAEFNDASALAPVPRASRARVDWCSAHRAGAAAATAARGARRRCPLVSAPTRTRRGPRAAARRRRVLRMAGVGSPGPASTAAARRLRCGAADARAPPGRLGAHRGPPARRRGGAALQHFTRGGRGGARWRRSPERCPTPARRRSRRPRGASGL